MSLSNLLYLTAAAAHGPLLYDYFRINWNKGHYQYFPLLFLVVGWLLFDRLWSPAVGAPNDRSVGVSRHRLEKLSGVLPMVLLGLCGLAVASATVIQSSFLVVPSLMLLVASWIIGQYGINGFRRSFPAWMLLVFAIPFPGGLDAVLVHRMQFLASGLASWILDSLGQIHFREGLTLVTAKKQFFTEEACSGIRSLFSSLAAITAYGVLHRFSLWRYIFNIIQVVLWVVVGNAIRIAIVVYVSDNWSDAIASGPGHEMLGIGVFGLIFGLALSTNRAVDAFWATWNSSFQSEFEPPDEIEIEALVIKPWRFSKPVTIAAMAFFGLVLLLGVRIAYAKHVFQPVVFSASDIHKSKVNDLPDVIDQWKVIDFDQSVRPQTSLLAPNSYLWTMQRGTDKIIISLDSPYHAFHDLTLCYQGLGWTVETRHDVVPEDGSDAFSLLSMTKRSDHGIVLFSAYGADGQHLSRSSAGSKSSRVRRHLLMAAGAYDPVVEKDSIAKLPVSQIQIFFQGSDDITDQQRADVTRLFLEVRKLLLETERFNSVATK